LTRDVPSASAGTVRGIDNRRLARVAKLAGAPAARAAGLVIHKQIGDRVEVGEPLFTVHAEAPGELDYALEYVRSHAAVVSVGA
jgi:thymidine phosphorylase